MIIIPFFIVTSDSLLGGKYRAVVFIHSTTVLTESVSPGATVRIGFNMTAHGVRPDKRRLFESGRLLDRLR